MQQLRAFWCRVTTRGFSGHSAPKARNTYSCRRWPGSRRPPWRRRRLRRCSWTWDRANDAWWRRRHQRGRFQEIRNRWSWYWDRPSWSSPPFCCDCLWNPVLSGLKIIKNFQIFSLQKQAHNWLNKLVDLLMRTVMFLCSQFVYFFSDKSFQQAPSSSM